MSLGSGLGLSLNMGDTTTVNTPAVNVTVTTALDSESYVDQIPVGLDTPLQVNFGAATATAYMSLSAAGTMTVLQAGYYEFRFRVNAGRTMAGGISILLARILANGVQVGPSLSMKIDNATNSQTIEATFSGQFPAGVAFVLQIMRDSAGTNNGRLSAFDPTLAGWNNVASADVLILRWTNVQQV